MKKLILLVSVLLAMSVSPASAEGVNLRWTNCYGDGGEQGRMFACDSNAGSHVLVGSFQLDTDLANVSGFEVTLFFTAASASVPRWWEFMNAGSCRESAVSIANGFDGTSCFEWSLGQATSVLVGYDVGFFFEPNRVRLRAISAVPNSALGMLAAGQEYKGFQISISNALTVDSACTGCLTPVCIVFNSLLVSTAGNVNNTTLSDAANHLSNHCSWQGDGMSSCPTVAPTRNATWGAIKSLYR